jgi:hypothetical protein
VRAGPTRSLTRATLAALAIAIGSAPASALAEKPRRGKKALEVGELSDRGRDDGTLQIVLGSLTLAASAALLANGGVEIHRGLVRTDECMVVDCSLDPPRLRYASAGLSFAFAVPIAVGGGLWVRQGVRKRSDARAWRVSQAISLAPAPLHKGAGMTFTLRF